MNADDLEPIVLPILLGPDKALKSCVLVVDAAHTLARVSREGHPGLAMQLALAQLSAAGVNIVDRERVESFSELFRERPPEPKLIDFERLPSGPFAETPARRRRSGFVDIQEPTNWKPGATRPAGSKLARKARRGKL